MKKFNTLVALTLTSALVACGGGSTGGNNDDTPAFGQAGAKFEFLPQKASLLSNRSGYPIDTASPYATRLDVRITGDNGNPALAAAIATLHSNNRDLISIEAPGVSTVCTQVGPQGIAGYTILSGELTGTATLSASIELPFTAGEIDPQTGVCKTSFPQQYRTVSGNFDYRVNTGPAPFAPIVATPVNSSLPINPGAPATVPTSQYVTAVTVRVFSPTGTPIPNLQSISATTTRADVALLSRPDDPETTVNEFRVISPNVLLDSKFVADGVGTFYVHSQNKSGVAPIRIAARTNTVTFLAEANITIGSGDGNQPLASLLMTSSVGPVYVRNTNGNTTANISTRLLDDSGNTFAANPSANNLLFEIVNVADESLSGRAASGATVEGASIRVQSAAGLAAVNLRSGTRQGIVTVKATGDRADNNVDNGIQNAVVTSRAVVISDGRLYDIKITSPVENTLVNEGVYAEATSPGADPTLLTAFGQYRVVLSVVATDRQGNPVLPGTPIEFGLIDAPMAGYPENGPGRFLIAGADGDPSEGGTTFSAPTGKFQTAAGGAGPGDTLIIFGEQDPANRDLESARRITNVRSETLLDIAAVTRFNLNDDTGVSVNRGPVLPYVIGRATIGTITNANAVTNEFGLATTTINYPVTRIGHGLVVWARGVGDTPAGQTTPELVSDVEPVVFPASGPRGERNIKLVASPSSIGSGRSLIQACLYDTFGNPIPGVDVAFGFDKVTGTVEGARGNFFPFATGANGCSQAFGTFFLAGTTGAAATDGKIILSALGQSGEIKVTDAGGVKLFALPEALGGGGGRVTLRLVDAFGNPISGIQIAGTCNTGTGSTTGGSAAIISPPGVTNSSGETTSDISANLNTVGTAPGTATCEFSALGAKATVRLQGLDVCTINISPRPPGCPAPVVAANVALTINLQNPAGGIYVSSNPQVQVVGNAGGINCVNTAPGFSGSCVGQVRNGSAVTLIASVGVNGGASPAAFCRWTGSAACFGNTPTIQIPVDAALTCNAIFTPDATAQPCPTR